MGRIAIIGSGLAAISAASVLIQKGIKPVILDYGENLPLETQKIVNKMASVDPQHWSAEELALISDNNTVKNKGALKKLSFGSDFFYGDSQKVFLSERLSNPPFSLAYGGFASGWGGAVLPADDEDLNEWPINSNNLAKHYVDILSSVHFSAKDDDLTSHFPLHVKPSHALKLTAGNEALLSAFRKHSKKFKTMSMLVGQARLLTNALDTGCQYCGYCMSGCVYDSIYKPTKELERLINAGHIDYEPGVFVHYLTEIRDGVNVHFTDKNQKSTTLTFDRVFLAAGAINSPKIILQSKRIYNKPIQLLSTNAFIAPLLSVKKNTLEWPHMNTQPGIFLEYKVPELSNHWIHTQLSTPNELVLKKLGLLDKKNILLPFRKKMAQHLYVAVCNMHSNHAVKQTISLAQNNLLISGSENQEQAIHAVNRAKRKLFTITKKIGCYVLMPFVQRYGSYHLGGSLPMKHNPMAETDTNHLGMPKDWSRVHVIDSSVFTGLPGTTIGLLAMANSRRITHETLETFKNT